MDNTNSLKERASVGLLLDDAASLHDAEYEYDDAEYENVPPR